MPHNHAHNHTPPADLAPAFRWAVGLNTAYVIVEADDTDAVLPDLSEGLAQTFGIAHSTSQIERDSCGARCLRGGA